jgi:enterobactin synthetase component D
LPEPSQTASPWDAVALPAELANAVRKRQAEYRAGRFCAMRALEAIGRAASAIGRGSAGEPLWPAGVVGSITHAGDVAWAAVAASTDAISIGIDSERLGERPRIDRLSAHVLLQRELRVGGGALDPQQRFTVVFSAKESIYKCLFPLVRVRFYFADVAIAALDVEQGTFAAQVVRPLGGGFDPGRRLLGRFTIGDGYVHTAVWIAPPVEGIEPVLAESGKIAGPPFPSLLPDSVPGTACRGAAVPVAPACADPAR